MKKKITKLTVVVLVVALALSVLAACDFLPTAEGETAYVKVTINPEVEFAVGEDNTVEAVNAANEDAEILLSDVDLIGLDIEEAVEEFVDIATEAGYIDEDAETEEENEVEVEIIGGDEETELQIRNRLRERINRYFNNNGIFGKVSEATLEEYAEQAAELGVSTGKTKMILKALDNNPELDIEELKDMEMKDLVKLFKDNANKGLDATVKAQYKEALKNGRADIVNAKDELDLLKDQLDYLLDEEEGRTRLAAAISEKQAEAAELNAEKLAEEQEEDVNQEKVSEINAEIEKVNAEILELQELSNNYETANMEQLRNEIAAKEAELAEAVEQYQTQEQTCLEECTQQRTQLRQNQRIQKQQRIAEHQARKANSNGSDTDDNSYNANGKDN